MKPIKKRTNIMSDPWSIPIDCKAVNFNFLKLNKLNSRRPPTELSFWAASILSLTLQDI
jgi:hypothetical protein